MKKNRILNKALSLTALIALGSCGTDSFFNKEAKGPQEPKALIASIGDVITSGGNNEKPIFQAGILILRAGPKEGPFQKPCAGQTGKMHQDTGLTKSCSGNNYIDIPLPTTGLTLSYNSLMAGNHNTGFGRKISLSMDEQLYSNGTTNEYYLMQGDGTILPFFHSNDGEWSSSNPVMARLTFERHTTGRMEIFPNGDKAEFTTSTSDPNVHRLTKYIDKNGNATLVNRNAVGKITEIVYPFNVKVTFTYTGDVVTSVKDPAGNNYTLTYDNNRLTGVTYPDGRKWQFFYNSGAHITRSISAAGEDLEYTYYPYGLESIKNALGYKTVFSYHKLGKVGARTAFTRTEESFDSSGRMISHSVNGKTSIYNRLENGLVGSVTDPIGRVTAYGYTTSYGMTDPRPTSITYPDGGGTQTVAYANSSRPGAPTQVTFTRGSMKTVATFDIWHGGITSLAKGSTGQDLTTFEYDLKGNLLKQISNGRTMVTYVRDALGRVTSATNEVGLKTLYAYSTDGHLSTVTDPFGRVTNYQADSLGNMTQATNSLLTYTNTYNNMGLPFGTSTVKGNNASSGEISTTRSISYFGSSAPASTMVLKKSNGNVQSTFDTLYKPYPGQIQRRNFTDSTSQSYNLEQ